jgi:hypothetical protein
VDRFVALEKSMGRGRDTLRRRTTPAFDQEGASEDGALEGSEEELLTQERQQREEEERVQKLRRQAPPALVLPLYPAKST